MQLADLSGHSRGQCPLRQLARSRAEAARHAMRHGCCHDRLRFGADHSLARAEGCRAVGVLADREEAIAMPVLATLEAVLQHRDAQNASSMSRLLTYPAMPEPRLTTFLISHFSEKVRWALDFESLAYDERRLLPG